MRTEKRTSPILPSPITTEFRAIKSLGVMLISPLLPITYRQNALQHALLIAYV